MAVPRLCCRQLGGGGAEWLLMMMFGGGLKSVSCLPNECLFFPLEPFNCCKSPDAPLASVELQDRGQHARTSFAFGQPLVGPTRQRSVHVIPRVVFHQLHSISTVNLSADVMIHCGFSWQPYFHVFVFSNVLKLSKTSSRDPGSDQRNDFMHDNHRNVFVFNHLTLLRLSVLQFHQ